MKLKVLLLTGLLTMGVAIAKALPALPEDITVTQPDGSKLTIRLHGDERFHYAGVLLTLTEDL